MGPIGFTQLFYLQEMKEIVDKLKVDINKKWEHWNKLLDHVKQKCYEFTSTLEKDQYEYQR